MTSEISREEVRSAIEDKLCAYFGITNEEATDAQIFQATAMVIREIMSRLMAGGQKSSGDREVHYMSMEFLMGRSLMKNAFNLGIDQAVSGALEDMGHKASDIFETEPDAGLGNGGLGRLAACYMDSMSSMDIPATGYSICYELGMFKQEIVDGEQTEVADDWRIAASSWLVPHADEAVQVNFGGQVTPQWDNMGRYNAKYTDYTTVIAVPRDMLIVGYGGKTVNTLRLWEAHSTDELNMYLFSEGKYVQSMEQRTLSEVITKVLYPADETIEGKTLRLKQQYFFVSATAQTIVLKHLKEYGDIKSFADHHVIQINDTHPTLVIPELMRLFMDDCGLGWDESWEIVKKCVAYTNHTVMSEALETWPQTLIQSILPRIWEIICEINRRWCENLVAQFGNSEKVGRNLIIRDGYVHMANMCLATCYKVNGVSTLHGEILKNDLFNDIYNLHPDRFTAVTNGIDHRRWLAQSNPRLHGLVCDLLGSDRYLTHPEDLEGLAKFADDTQVQKKLEEIKHLNKIDFAAFAKRNDNGYILNTDALMDVQIKRLHEYKRQLLCAMLITHLQMTIHDNPNRELQPVTFVFGAKAAAGYKVAKRIIELLCSLSDELANDPLCKDRLQVYFMQNYRVSAAEALMPAAQVSEQISTAGKEASGTGNMKLMMNGAVTIGTLDGANVEMYDLLGDENMYLFGLHTEQVIEMKNNGYNPQAIYNDNYNVRRVLDRFNQGFHDGKNYSDLVSNLVYNGDQYMLLADFEDYMQTHERLFADMRDDAKREKMSMMNIAKSGFFAADRAIQEYADNIWYIKK